MFIIYPNSGTAVSSHGQEFWRWVPRDKMEIEVKGWEVVPCISEEAPADTLVPDHSRPWRSMPKLWTWLSTPVEASVAGAAPAVCVSSIIFPIRYIDMDGYLLPTPNRVDNLNPWNTWELWTYHTALRNKCPAWHVWEFSGEVIFMSTST